MSIGNAFRMYAEVAGSSRTGIAIQNTGPTTAHVRLELSRLDGTRLALAGSLDFPAFGQRSLFLNEVQGLESIPNPFQGIVRISTTNQGTISVLGLQSRTNERGDFLITTTPAIDENAAAHSQIVFPQAVNGGGYRTQFISFSGTPTEPAQARQGAAINKSGRSHRNMACERPPRLRCLRHPSSRGGECQFHSLKSKACLIIIVAA
jgi:hypothetical protein